MAARSPRGTAAPGCCQRSPRSAAGAGLPMDVPLGSPGIGPGMAGWAIAAPREAPPAIALVPMPRIPPARPGDRLVRPADALVPAPDGPGASDATPAPDGTGTRMARSACGSLRQSAA